MDRRPEQRRAMTLKEQLSTPAEPAIRDFLRIPHDDDDDDDDDCPEETPCTLMDAIDRDVRGEGGAGGAINWKPLRHRLWLRRAAGAWHAPGSETKPSAAVNRVAPRCSSKCNYSSGEASAAFSRAVVDDEDGADVEVEAEDNGLPPPAAASTSLMTLMEQADGHWDEAGEDGGASRRGAVGDDDEDGHGEGRHGGEEEEEEEEVQVCCVCMVRHKGAAFIPCGHTFCRLCSRELRHTRGNCPLCNVFIQDILHIF